MTSKSCGRECYKCRYGDQGCLQGHEAEEVTPATEQQLLWRLQDKRWRSDRQKIVAALEEMGRCKSRT